MPLKLGGVFKKKNKSKGERALWPRRCLGGLRGVSRWVPSSEGSSVTSGRALLGLSGPPPPQRCSDLVATEQSGEKLRCGTRRAIPGAEAGPGRWGASGKIGRLREGEAAPWGRRVWGGRVWRRRVRGLPLPAAGGSARGGGRGARPALPGPRRRRSALRGRQRLAGGSAGPPASVPPALPFSRPACLSRRGQRQPRDPLPRGRRLPLSLLAFLSASSPAGESRRLAPPGSLGAPQPSLLLPMGIREFPNGSARGKAATLWVPRGRAGGRAGGTGTPHTAPAHLTLPGGAARSRGSLRWREAGKVVGAAGPGRLPCRRGSHRPPPTSPGAGGGRRRWQRGPGLTALSRPAAACGAPPMSAPGGCPTSARSCGSSSTWWWTRPLKRTWSGPAPWKTSPARPWGSPPSRSASSASPATTATSPGLPATNVSPRHGRARRVARTGGERGQPGAGWGVWVRGADRFTAGTNLAPCEEVLSLLGEEFCARVALVLWQWLVHESVVLRMMTVKFC